MHWAVLAMNLLKATEDFPLTIGLGISVKFNIELREMNA